MFHACAVTEVQIVEAGESAQVRRCAVEETATTLMQKIVRDMRREGVDEPADVAHLPSRRGTGLSGVYCLRWCCLASQNGEVAAECNSRRTMPYLLLTQRGQWATWPCTLTAHCCILQPSCAGRFL